MKLLTCMIESILLTQIEDGKFKDICNYNGQYGNLQGTQRILKD